MTYGGEPQTAKEATSQRLNSRDVLFELLAAYRTRCNQLETLARTLPLELPFAADEALRSSFKLEHTLLAKLYR